MTENIFPPMVQDGISNIVRKTFEVSLANDTFKHWFCSQSEMQQFNTLILEAIKTANIYEIINMSIILFKCTKSSASIFGVLKPGG